MRIGIDLGGTSIKAALCTAEGKILQRADCPTCTGDAAALKKAMKTLAVSLCKAQGVSPDRIEMIGIGVPGSIDKAGQRLLVGTNLNLRDVYLGDTFAPAFSCPVQLENDANCAALGEAAAGAASTANHMILLTLGTGVGGGMVIGGKLYTGCNGIAGELGHMVIRQDGEPCNCGRRGCLEAYASAAALVRFAHRAIKEGHKSCLEAYGEELNAKQICEAVDAGDPLACALFAQYCTDLSCGLANLINIFQPDCIVLGGGLAGYGEKLLEPLRKKTLTQVFRGVGQNTKLVAASLGNDAGMIGAALL